MRRYERPVFNLIVRMVADRAVAEDLAQETFLKVFGRLETFDPDRKFSNWLLKIAHNTTIDYLRRGRPDIVSLDADAAADRPPRELADTRVENPAQAFERRSLGEALERALAGLRPEYRAVIVLRYHEGLAYEEIADVLDVPLGTVKTHVHRARKAMADLMREAGWTV